MAISALPLACGDDEDDGDDGGKGGKGGTSSGGSSGATTGGRGGSGGSGPTGGSAGRGGQGGTTGGSAGSSTGGMGGAEGGMGGDEGGGMGGAGGEVEPPMSPCEQANAAADAATDCASQDDFLATCADSYNYGGKTCIDEMDALWTCTAAAAGANWSCNATSMLPEFDFTGACTDEVYAAVAGSCI